MLNYSMTYSKQAIIDSSSLKGWYFRHKNTVSLFVNGHLFHK